MTQVSLARALALGIGVTVAGGLTTEVAAQTERPHAAPSIWLPQSSLQQPEDIGIKFHTHLIGLTMATRGLTPPASKGSNAFAPNTVPATGYFYETPASLACVYGLTANTNGCNPNLVTAVASSGGSPLSIAIVDAYHNPNITSDLASFDAQFGLPAPPKFQVVCASSRCPADSSGGWELESSLDVEYAHAMSPGAKLYLVEAASSGGNDLLAAVDKAASLVAADGGGIVSMSWGGSEWNGETAYDSHFQKSGVTFVASTGDAPGVSWPSISAYVVAAGGTSLSRNPSTGTFIGEGTWQLAGAGTSAYVTRPNYQSSVSSITGSFRGVPDIAAVADPYTGVWVYSGYNGGWYYGVGGTSVAAPLTAGMMSHKGTKYTGINGLVTAIYGGTYGTFRDITIGNCGPYTGYVAGTGWDLCSGRGSMLGGN
jgi:kumamolisin